LASSSVAAEPFGTYAEAAQTGNLLFLIGMVPTEGRAAKFIGLVGAELDAAGRNAAYLLSDPTWLFANEAEKSGIREI
jgi:hypothetical protein